MSTYFTRSYPSVREVHQVGTLPPCREHSWSKVQRSNGRYRAKQCQDCGYKITTWVKTH